MRFHIEAIAGGNLCGSPGESHSALAPMSEDDHWCSMCARIYNGGAR